MAVTPRCHTLADAPGAATLAGQMLVLAADYPGQSAATLAPLADLPRLTSLKM